MLRFRCRDLSYGMHSMPSGWAASLPHTALTGTHHGLLEIGLGDRTLTRQLTSFDVRPTQIETTPILPASRETGSVHANQGPEVVIEYSEDAGCQSAARHCHCSFYSSRLLAGGFSVANVGLCYLGCSPSLYRTSSLALAQRLCSTGCPVSAPRSPRQQQRQRIPHLHSKQHRRR